MAALWTFAAVVTVREGLNVLFVGTLDTEVGRPTEALLDALQQERRISAVAASGDATADQRESLATSRSRTDETVAAWREHALGGGLLGLAASDELTVLIDETDQQLAGLAQLRDDIDDARLDRHATVSSFTTMIDAGFAIYTSVSALDDVEIARQARTLIALSQARELVSRQDSLLAGALAAGRLTDQDISELTRLVISQRFLYENTAAQLEPEDHALYQATVTGPTVSALHQLQDTLLTEARPGAAPPFSAETWDGTTGPALAALRDLELDATDNLVARATPVSVGIIIRLILAGGLGLVALVAAIIVSITTARSLLRQLERLRDSARDLAHHRLPRVVSRLSAGEEVDVGVEAPPLSFGNDEIGQVGQAFNAVQETAVRAAVQQAELRHGVRDVFLSLARRTQNLVHKQLRLLDAMERRQTDADEVEDLFRVDHLATRMRRNAENLIVLSGAAHGRTWRHPVAMIDVVRGAVAEVEDYTRVTLLPVESGALEGRAVGDVIHLLAELIENAVSFSPPYASVTVGGQRVAHGFVVEIEDRGLGMSEEDLTAANQVLANPPDFSVADASRLGHYVVAKLSQRHEINVHLRRSPYGGIIAIVLVPSTLVSGAGDPPAEEPNGAPVLPSRTSAGGGVALDAPAPVRLARRRHELDVRPAAEPPADPLPSTAPPKVVGSAEVPAADPPDAPARTPSGLPWRVRQASLPKQLREGPDGEGETEEQPYRDPELVRQMMRAYQDGTQRGRADGTADGQEGMRSGAED